MILISKRLGLIFLCLLSICFTGCTAVRTGYGQTEYEQTFQEAQSAFDAENYVLAVSLYHQLIEKGVRTGAVYYNLGNAQAKLGNPAHAVAAYYLAKRYIPNDPHLHANLNAVLSENGRSLPDTENALLHSLFFWQNRVGYPAKMAVSLIMVAILFLLGVLFLRYQTKWVRRFLIGWSLFTIIALLSAGYDVYRFEKIDWVVLIPNALPRKGNSDQYEPVFTTPMPLGTWGIILDERNGWYSLRFPNRQEGWLPFSQAVPLE